MTSLSFSPEKQYAQQLDAEDELASLRDEFVLPESDLIYLDGNSLGPLTHCTQARLQSAVTQEWGQELVRGWNQGWYTASTRIGEKIARLVGAAEGQVIISDSTSVNLFKLVLAALALKPERKTIVSDMLNFPSDLYILQGCVRLLGNRHQIRMVTSADGIQPDLEQLYNAIDGETALVTLSHVTFKSGYLYDVAAVTERAHQAGALVLWDLSHSVGVVPIELDQWGVDLAVGCTYKYLNGGPGAPAFLYVRQDLQERMQNPISGWFGQQGPFAFDLDYTPAAGITRFLSGTPPILSLLAIEPALDIILDAGINSIRHKSSDLTSYLVDLVNVYLGPLEFILGSPREAERRGSHISLHHPEGYRINRALIDEMHVLPDFREPDNLRLGLAPLYTTFTEVWQAVDRIRQVVEQQHYLHYPLERLPVT